MKVAKTFSLDLDVALWLDKQRYENHLNTSDFLNKIIKREMENDQS